MSIASVDFDTCHVPEFYRRIRYEFLFPILGRFRIAVEPCSDEADYQEHSSWS